MAALRSPRRTTAKALPWVAVLALAIAVPEAAAAVVTAAAAVAGAVCVWAAGQPIVVTFAAGAWAGWRLARRRAGGWAR